MGKATVRADFAEGKLKSLDLSNKKTLIDSKHKSLTISEQCEILNISRSSYYYEPVGLDTQDIKILHKIDVYIQMHLSMDIDAFICN